MRSRLFYLAVIVVLVGQTAAAAKESLDGAAAGTDEDKQKIRSKHHSSPPVAMNTFVSPSRGTDVLTHPIAVIKCANQTLCIQPKLQLTETYDVYYCKHVGHGVRFYYLAKEGLLLHPNIRMVHDIDKAQMIVYLPESSPWHKSECSKPEYKSRTIVLDEGDGPQLFEPDGTYLHTEYLGTP